MRVPMKAVGFLFFASLLGIEAQNPSYSKALVYFIPFQFETYEAVTPEKIREKAKYKVEITERNTLSVLVDLLLNGRRSEQFDEHRVRLL
jgi:hypothetical protein